MANPTVTATLNKSLYAPGELMVLTVQYADADNRDETHTTTITGTDEAGNATVVTVQRTVRFTDQVTLSTSDSAGKTFLKQSDNGNTAVYHATA